jgi:hypothetical protein
LHPWNETDLVMVYYLFDIFCLPVFCWESLHPYSLKIWSIILFSGYIFIGFWNECNAGIIGWVW